MRAGFSFLASDLRSLPRMVWLLYAGVFLIRFGSFVVFFLVAWLTSRGHSPGAAGAAVAAYGGGHLIASWLGGWMADRIGRRETIVLSMFSAAASLLALA